MVLDIIYAKDTKYRANADKAIEKVLRYLGTQLSLSEKDLEKATQLEVQVLKKRTPLPPQPEDPDEAQPGKKAKKEQKDKGKDKGKDKEKGKEKEKDKGKDKATSVAVKGKEKRKSSQSEKPGHPKKKK